MIDKELYNIFYTSTSKSLWPDDSFTYERLDMSNNPDLSFTLSNDKGDIFLLTKMLLLNSKRNLLYISLLDEVNNLNLFEKEEFSLYKSLLGDKQEIIDQNKDIYLCIPYYKTSDDKNETELNLYKLPTRRKINKEAHYCIEINENYKTFKGLYSANTLFVDKDIYSHATEDTMWACTGRRLKESFITYNKNTTRIHIGYEGLFKYPNYQTGTYKDSQVLTVIACNNEKDKEIGKEFNKDEISQAIVQKMQECMEPIYVLNINTLKESFNDEDFGMYDIINNTESNNIVEVVNICKENFFK